MNIGFYLEHINEVEKAKLLIRSIKDHIKDANIYAVTQHEVMLNDCNMIKADINIHDYLYFVDKVHAASIFENIVSAPYLWIDIDTLFLKPMDTICKENAAICLNPVDIKNIGILRGQEIPDIWSNTMENLELNDMNHYVISRISREVILSYYNIGMVYVNKDHSLFKMTYEKLIELSKHKSIKHIIKADPLLPIFYHQLVFSLMVEKLYNQKISELGEYINYPLHLMEKDINKPNGSQLISIRYDNYFKSHEIPDFLKKTINISKSYL